MMTDRDVEAMARSVIVERGLPFQVLAVTFLPSAWAIQLRHQSGTVVSVRVPAGRPAAVRVAIQEQLEDEQ
jgi:hypothetical protein